MKKILGATAFLLLAVGLAGCSDGKPVPSHAERVQKNYEICVEAGGSFEYNASLPYWACHMPGVEEK